MKKTLFLLLFIIELEPVVAQIDVLQEIERNNTVLSALRQQMEADKTENKIGIYPENPEVEFHYLWGNLAEMGNRVDWSASQSFDFPTAYHYKRKISNLKNQQLELQYRIDRKDVLSEASSVCIQLIYWNALSEKLKERLDQIQQMTNAYQRRYETGDASLLDLNKIKYDLLNVRKDHQNALTEKEFFQLELVRLNGGISLQLSTRDFPQIIMPDHFEQWYKDQKERNLYLKQYQQEINIGKENEKLQRSLNLPKITAGYMSESVLTERFQGLILGVSIPLWENKNTVKQIKAQTLANQELEKNAALRDYYHTESLFKKALNLYRILGEIKNQQEEDYTVGLLNRSLQLGEMSLTEFILELNVYYDMQRSKLETERDLHLIISELMQWDL